MYDKIIFDFKDKYHPFYKKTIKNNILIITFKKNPFNNFYIKIFSPDKEKIFITDNFKNSKYNINLKNPSSEKIFLNNFDTIIKNMKFRIKTAMICSERKTNDIYFIIDSLIFVCEHIYISTSDDTFFDKINNYSINKYGLGLLRKEITGNFEYDVIIILNERISDFYKKGRYVINLMQNHPVFNCNLLWDIYDKNSCETDGLEIKKVYFLSKDSKFFDLKWKIMKKS